MPVPASRSLLVCWWLWCAALALALGLGTALPAWARMVAVVFIASLGWRGHCQIWRNPTAVRQLGWNADGQWLLVSDRGLQSGVEWLPPLQQLGPWLWACFLVAGHKKWVLIDTQLTEPGALCAFKARATLLRR
jgi:hypothetical protein